MQIQDNLASFIEVGTYLMLVAAVGLILLRGLYKSKKVQDLIMGKDFK